MAVEHVTLTLGAEKVVLPRDDVEQIRERLVEPLLETQELREVLAGALTTGSGRITEAHRADLLSALKAIHSLEMRRLGTSRRNRSCSRMACEVRVKLLVVLATAAAIAATGAGRMFVDSDYAVDPCFPWGVSSASPIVACSPIAPTGAPNGPGPTTPSGPTPSGPHH